MKPLKFLLFGIILWGNTQNIFWQTNLEVAKKYSLFFAQDIMIEVNDASHSNCGIEAYGCTTEYRDGHREIWVSSGLPYWSFTYVMLHEIYHYYYGGGEQQADEYRDSMINYVENLK